MKIKANLYKVNNEDPLGVNIDDKKKRMERKIVMEHVYFFIGK